MTSLEKYQKRKDRVFTPTSLSEIAVFRIIDDLLCRRGLRQEFEQIDDDVKSDIIKEWVSIVDDCVYEIVTRTIQTS